MLFINLFFPKVSKFYEVQSGRFVIPDYATCKKILLCSWFSYHNLPMVILLKFFWWNIFQNCTLWEFLCTVWYRAHYFLLFLTYYSILVSKFFPYCRVHSTQTVMSDDMLRHARVVIWYHRWICRFINVGMTMSIL